MYYPNIIGQAAPATSKTYAFLVEGKYDKGEISLVVMNHLLKRGARILSQNGRVNERTGDFTLCIVCDMREMNDTPDDIVIQVRRMKNVRHAQGVSLRNNMFDGLLFPFVSMDTDRLVAINSNLTFQIQEKLNTQSEKSIFVEAAVDYGKLIVERMRQKFNDRRDAKSSPQPSIEAIQENVRGYMIASGWGRFNWQTEESIERVLINDPPTATIGGSGEGNLFLQGMVAGMMEGFRGKRYSIIEDHYNVQSRLLTLAYVEQSLVKPVETQSREQLESTEQNVKVLEEIEKIIDAVEGKEQKLAQENESAKQPIEQVVKAPVAGADSGMRVQVALKRKGRGPGTTKKPADDRNETKVEKSNPSNDTKTDPPKDSNQTQQEVKIPEAVNTKQEGKSDEAAAGADSVLILASEKERQVKEVESNPTKNPSTKDSVIAPKAEPGDPAKNSASENASHAEVKIKGPWKKVAKNPPGYVDEFTISDEVNDETLWL